MTENATKDGATVFDLTITLEDYNAFQKEICRPPRPVTLRRKYALGAVWLFSVAIFTVLFQTGLLHGRDLVVMLGSLVSVCLVAQWLSVRTRARLSPAHDGALLGAVRIELGEPRIHVTSRHVEATVSWSAVRELRETPTHLFLMIDTAAGYILPKRSLGNDAAVWALRSLLAQRITMGRAAATSEIGGEQSPG